MTEANIGIPKITPENPKSEAPKYTDMKAEAGEISTLSAFIFGEIKEFSANCVSSTANNDKIAVNGELRYAIKTIGTPPIKGPITGIKQNIP